MKIRSRTRLALAALVGIAVVPAPAASGDVGPGQEQTTLADFGATYVVPVAVFPDGRVLVGEHWTGRIRLVRNGSLLAAPYATLPVVSSLTSSDIAASFGGYHAGLVSLLINPANNDVYCYYTSRSNPSETVASVARYRDAGDTGTGFAVIVDNIPLGAGYGRHGGSGMSIGPDGRLYVCVGDGASDPTISENPANWRGKILRFNLDGTVPTDNPFGASNPVWAVGFRNNFRHAWQPGTGRMYVSENAYSGDEVSRVSAGGNYSDATGQVLITLGGVPTGLHFYRGTSLPYTGQMLYASYRGGTIARVSLTADGNGVASGPADVVWNVPNVCDLAEGPDGSIYFTQRAPNLLVRVRASGGAGNQPPTASFTANPTSGPAPLAVGVNGSASSDPDGTIAAYSWNWGDGTPGGSGVTASHTYQAAGTYALTLTVTDNAGATATATRTVTVTGAGGGNLAPSAHIEDGSPPAGPAPLQVTLVGHGHDRNLSDVLELRWDFGDGSPREYFTGLVLTDSDGDAEGDTVNVTVTHTYSAAGTYTCTLRARDSAGLTGTHTWTIAVTDPGGGGSEGSRDGNEGLCGLLGLECLALGLIAAGRRRAKGKKSIRPLLLRA